MIPRLCLSLNYKALWTEQNYIKNELNNSYFTSENEQ